MAYLVTKTYGHELGLSAVFRQWRATSHCRFLHGYALSFKFVFESDTLDENNWVIDFGGLKPLKQWLVETFDHKLILAEDDPRLNDLFSLSDQHAEHGALAECTVFDNVGCEAFAFEAAKVAKRVAASYSRNDVRLVSVEVREHGANSAIYLVGA